MKKIYGVIVSLIGAYGLLISRGLAQTPELEPQSAANSALAAGLYIPQNLSPIGMFLQADWVVKAVMICLALASVATWTIFIAKSLELSAAKRKAVTALKAVGNAKNLSQLVEVMMEKKGVSSLLVRAAALEVHASLPAIDEAGSDGLKERVHSVLSRIQARAGRAMGRGTGCIATIGSIGPFVGLFGTVWGIMNSFIGISHAQTTNLAVVAPGIAEALLATAIGLIAAIPAVVIFNIFARSINGYKALLTDVSAAIERLVSRDLDFRTARLGEREETRKMAAE